MGDNGCISIPGLMLALDHQIRRESIAVSFVMVTTVLCLSRGQRQNEAQHLSVRRRAHQARMSVL